MTAPTDFIEIPSGALCGEVMQLTCKGPDEERSYVIEYSQQLDPDDYIATDGITWTAGDTALSVTNITSHGRRFRFTLSGGTLNQKSGLTFVLPLVSGDVREITFVITIEAQGVLQSGTIPVIMGAQGSRGTIIWPYIGNTVPPNDWVPQSGVPIRSGDFVLVSGLNEIYEITVANDGTATYSLFLNLNVDAIVSADTVIQTKTNNSVTLGNIADTSVTNEDFLVTDEMWCAYISGLPTSDPGSPGSFWNNAGVVTCSTSGLNFTGTVSRKISVAAINFWMDGLPTSDPKTAGSVWNNAGVPTVSVSGYGDTSGYSGVKISDSSLNYLLLEMPKISGNTIPNIGLNNIWVNNSYVLTRI